MFRPRPWRAGVAGRRAYRKSRVEILAGKKRIIAFALLAVFLLATGHAPAFAQAHRTTRKIDEYSGDRRYEDEIARLDYALSLEAVKEPHARLYIIGYGLPGTARRRVMRAYSYVVKTRGVDASRAVPVVGGYREEQAVELWVVPEGDSAPVPSPSAPVGGAANVARKYDEFILQGEWFYHQKEPVLLDGLADVLKMEPASRGHIVVYKGRGPRCEYCYFQGRELSFAKEQKQYLVKKHRIAPSRIKIVDGGHGWSTMEYWIVPRGVRPPTPRKNTSNPKR